MVIVYPCDFEVLSFLRGLQPEPDWFAHNLDALDGHQLQVVLAVGVRPRRAVAKDRWRVDLVGAVCR